MLLDLGVELRHELLGVALEVQEAPARGVDGHPEGRLNRSHGLTHVGMRRGEMAADLQHLGLVMPHQAREGIRDSLHLALRGVDPRCLLIGRIDQRRDHAVNFLRAHGHARSRWAQARTLRWGLGGSRRPARVPAPAAAAPRSCSCRRAPHRWDCRRRRRRHRQLLRHCLRANSQRRISNTR